MQPVRGPSRPCRAAFAATFIAIAATVGASGVAGASSPQKKGLSQSAVTIIGPTTTIMAPVWVASARGFYKRLGVNASLINSPASASTIIAVLLAGSAQFAAGSASASMPAIQGGAPIRAVQVLQQDDAQEVVINASTAAAHGIPTSGTTEASAIKQIDALKGSHLNIGVSNLTSDGYGWFVTIAKDQGLTVGSTLGNSSSDVNVVVGGSSPTALVTAFQAGKLDGFINTPPVTVLTTPATITIEMSHIPPVTLASTKYLTATTAMINQHPDTVQAVVTATVQGMLYIHSHPSQAERDVAAQFASFGITSPEEATYLFQAYVPFDKSPYPSKTGFSYTKLLANAVQTTPLTLTFAQFIYLRFINATMTTLGLPIPK